MKKKYFEPNIKVLAISECSPLMTSGEENPGDIISGGTTDDEGFGGLAKPHSVWEEEEEEE